MWDRGLHSYAMVNATLKQGCSYLGRIPAGYEILNDGIYQNDEKLGEVGQTDGNWWFTRAADETQRVPCDSAMEAVRRLCPSQTSLSMVDVSTDGKSIFDEYFLEQPLEQLTGDKLQRLLEKTELVTA